MHAAAILLGLVATVSAIDVYGYPTNSQCKGNSYEVHRNVNPGDCAISSTGNNYQSIGWRAIPSNWRINGNAYRDGGCGNVAYVATSNGAENICAGGWWYSGGKYEFAGKKRSTAANEARAATEDCKNVRRSDAIVFEDGTTYELDGLTEAEHTEMNGGSQADIPAKFDAYKAQ